MSFDSPINEISKDKLGGIFLGTVVSNQDPMNLMRVKVRIPEVHGTSDSGISDAHLPYATPMHPAGLGSSAGTGYFAVPRNGSKVYVMFHKSNVYSPIYIGSPVLPGANGVGSVFTSTEDWGAKDSKGNYYKFNQSTGNLEVKVKKDLNISVEGNATLSVTGNITITGNGFSLTSSGGSVTVNGSSVTVTAGTVNLGNGTLKGVARLGDTVQVGGSTGTITSASSSIKAS